MGGYCDARMTRLTPMRNNLKSTWAKLDMNPQTAGPHNVRGIDTVSAVIIAFARQCFHTDYPMRSKRAEYPEGRISPEFQKISGGEVGPPVRPVMGTWTGFLCTGFPGTASCSWTALSTTASSRTLASFLSPLACGEGAGVMVKRFRLIG